MCIVQCAFDCVTHLLLRSLVSSVHSFKWCFSFHFILDARVQCSTPLEFGETQTNELDVKNSQTIWIFQCRSPHLLQANRYETHTEVNSINRRAFKLEFQRQSSAYRKHAFCSVEIRWTFIHTCFSLSNQLKVARLESNTSLFFSFSKQMSINIRLRNAQNDYRRERGRVGVCIENQGTQEWETEK